MPIDQSSPWKRASLFPDDPLELTFRCAADIQSDNTVFLLALYIKLLHARSGGPDKPINFTWYFQGIYIVSIFLPAVFAYVHAIFGMDYIYIFSYNHLHMKLFILRKNRC